MFQFSSFSVLHLISNRSSDFASWSAALCRVQAFILAKCNTFFLLWVKYWNFSMYSMQISKKNLLFAPTFPDLWARDTVVTLTVAAKQIRILNSPHLVSLCSCETSNRQSFPPPDSDAWICASVGAHGIQARHHRGPSLRALGLDWRGWQRLRLARRDLLRAPGLRHLPVRNSTRST